MTPGRSEEWVLATTNVGKLAEFRDLTSGSRLRLRSLDPAMIDTPDETGLSFVENALIKARHASSVTGSRAIADDSGLCVAALGGAPGVQSARYAGPGASDRENIEKLMLAMDGIEAERRQAAFHCVIVALTAPDDPAPVIASGSWPGLIALSPRGQNGFGYDPIFLDSALGMTAAELDPGTKNAASHRGRACRKLLDLLGLAND